MPGLEARVSQVQGKVGFMLESVRPDAWGIEIPLGTTHQSRVWWCGCIWSMDFASGRTSDASRHCMSTFFTRWCRAIARFSVLLQYLEYI